MEHGDFDVREIQWEEAAKEIKKNNKNLFNAIESSSFEKDFTLIKARYPYGAKIVEDGVLNLPHKSGICVPITSSVGNEKLVEKLSYSTIPLGFLCNKASEIYIERDNRPMPLKLLHPGDLFGLFETVDAMCGIGENTNWCVSSGARSLFMLPKIADKTGYQRIKKEFTIDVEPPRNLAEHWQVFVALCNQMNNADKWYSEVYFFTAPWFKKWQEETKSISFYNYIFKESVVQRHYSNLNIGFDLDWNDFSRVIGHRKFRPRPYLLDTLKYLIAISRGIFPGFKVADTSDIVAPITLLQKIYVDVYGLKNYLPTLMHPFNLMRDIGQSPVYYSLSFPSIVEGVSVYKNSGSDIIADLRLLKRLMDTTDSKLNSANYDYFHSESDIYHEMKVAVELPSTDFSFLQDKANFPDRSFCATAPFFSGCIKITI